MNEQTAADPWQVLDSKPTTDRSAIKKAYARRLKAIDPETDPAAFIELRHARDWAMWQAEAAGEQLAPVPEACALAPSVPQAELSVELQPDAPPTGTHHPDREAIAALNAMILDPNSTATAADIEAQAERVLADPSLVNIDEAGRMEDFISNLIVHGTARRAATRYSIRRSATSAGMPTGRNSIISRSSAGSRNGKSTSTSRTVCRTATASMPAYFAGCGSPTCRDSHAGRRGASARVSNIF